jgi:DNA gyrase subunit A
MSYAPNELVISRNVEDEMKDSYLRYSMSVIIARALPDVRDGLKPSQRRILYAMKQLNLGPSSKHRKCAKISGDTSGDYHPHGEQVIYPTLVRMAQPWAMRYTLVEGQGNFGSIDGDPPAAMRYTEARLTHAAMQLMEDLEKDTVDVIPNYDETKSEPTVFPAKFPNLLCNGSSGIAVGMATNIPSHNLNELIAATLLVLENTQTTIDEIMTVMPAPDFATGGMICGYRGIKEAYHTGRGKLILRGVIRVEDIEESQERQQIIVDEIPYNVNKARLIEQVAELITNKQVTGISDLRDESDNQGLRIVMELKRGEIPEVIINQLYKFTDLQVTFGCNMLALDHGLPRIMNIKQFITAWIEHRIEVIRRRTRFELNKAEARAHILEGYLKAIDHLDEVVRLIRSSNNREHAKKELMERFLFTDKQAHAVLELRLYQLTGLEHDKINQEYQEFLKKIEYYRAVLASEAMVRGIIKEELEEIQKYHKKERQTQIVPAEGEMQMEDLIANERVIITVSEDDYIKRMPSNLFKEQRRGGQGVSGIQMKREDDAIKGLYVANAHNYLLFFTSLGRCYWLKAWQIPETGRKSKGKPLINLLEDLQPNEKIATILCVANFDEEACILMTTKKAVVKKTELALFSNPRRKGVWALDLDEGDEVVAARLVKKGQQVMLFTHEGMAVRFDESKVRSMGRIARGVRGASLRGENDYIVGCEVVNGTETVLVVCENGFGKRSQVEDFRQTNRGGVGVKSIITSERNGKVVSALCITDMDGIVMISSAGQTVRISMKDVRVMGRNTQGVKLVNLREEDVLVAVQKLEGSDTEEEAGGVTEVQEGVVQEDVASDMVQDDIILESSNAQQ